MLGINDNPYLDGGYIASAESVAVYLGPLGLIVDRTSLPLFSLLDLFEVLLKPKHISKSRIKHKISSLQAYLKSKLPAMNRVLKPIDCMQLQDEKDINYELFDSNLINLFSFAFEIRVEIYTVFCGRLSIQYFGFKNKPTRRILVSSESYFLLKKTTLKPGVPFFKRCKDLSLNSSINKLNSEVTTTQTRDQDSDGLNIMTIPLQQDSFLDTQKSIFQPTEEIMSQIVPNSSNKIQIEDIQFNLTNLQPCLQDDQLLKNTGFSTSASFPFIYNDKIADGKLVGRLKFYNEAKEYGFIIMDDESEIFVHKADLTKQNIDTRYLAYYKKYYEIFMKFTVQEYQGKSQRHRKAIDVLICDMQAIC